MSKKKVLIVDDSKVTSRSVSMLLEKNNFEALVLDNAEDLLTFAYRYSDVNLILLDINLPGMDGLTALSYVKQLSMINHIPVVIISGDSDIEIVKKAASLSAVDYVIKPYIPIKLLAKIQQIIGPDEVSGQVQENNLASPGKDKDTPEEA